MAEDLTKPPHNLGKVTRFGNAVPLPGYVEQRAQWRNRPAVQIQADRKNDDEHWTGWRLALAWIGALIASYVVLVGAGWLLVKLAQFVVRLA